MQRIYNVAIISIDCVLTCRAFTKYVSCAEASVIGVCRIGAEEVMKNMTEMYVFPMRRALQCPVDQLGMGN